MGTAGRITRVLCQRIVPFMLSPTVGVEGQELPSFAFGATAL